MGHLLSLPACIYSLILAILRSGASISSPQLSPAGFGQMKRRGSLVKPSHPGRRFNSPPGLQTNDLV
jgi:hypothetical protein